MKNTTLCYIQREGQYLMLHRVKKKNDVNQDKWVGIGGKFEDKESPEDCLLREVQEETGLTLTSYAYRGLVTFVSDQWETEYMHLFTADAFEGEIGPCDEGNLEWVDKDKVKDLPIWVGDKIFLDLLTQEVPFFSLKLAYEGETLVEAVLNGQELSTQV
ncbi:MAG: 8-oxo-dGTP diphosphatase [Ruminiclostridium sp.]|nr:8-oxo-dGTP diphosphatase [Ruminiclostridium sp.]